MFIGNYAVTKPYVCPQCYGQKDKGCSNCNNQGIKVRHLQVISEEPINHNHIKVQSHLKPIKGYIIEESDSKEIVEKTKDD